MSVNAYAAAQNAQSGRATPSNGLNKSPIHAARFWATAFGVNLSTWKVKVAERIMNLKLRCTMSSNAHADVRIAQPFRFTHSNVQTTRVQRSGATVTLSTERKSSNKRTSTPPPMTPKRGSGVSVSKQYLFQNNQYLFII
jgi:hypothetical protein